MIFGKMQQTWDGVGKENKLLRMLCLGLMGLCLMTTGALVFRGETVVMIPPHLDERTELTMRKADGGYKRAWGLHVSILMGNLHPGNLDFVMNSLGPILGPQIYEEFRQAAAKQAETFKKGNYSMSFQPMQVIYEPTTDKVFVTGRSRIESAIIAPKGMAGAGNAIQDYFDKTYEYVIRINNGRPLVAFINNYEGQPRTERVIQNETRNTQRMEENKNRELMEEYKTQQAIDKLRKQEEESQKADSQ